MSKIRNNPIMKGASGMLGKTVVYRETKDGTLIMANKPRKTGIVTDQQLIIQARFEAAALYAKAQLTNPASKAEYTAAGASKNRSAYQAAMTDYLRAPKLVQCNTDSYTGAVGDAIDIMAFDDFRLTSVQVRITSAAGETLEQGAATARPLTPGTYQYAVTAANAELQGTKVIVTLRDQPGNVTVSEKVLL